MDDVEEEEGDKAAAMSYLEKKFVKALSQALGPPPTPLHATPLASCRERQ